MRNTIVASALLALGLAASTTPSSAADRNAHDLAGVWWAKASVLRLLPVDGKALPFTTEGRARYEKIVAGLKSGAIVDQAVYLCLPEGMPRAMTSAYPFQIMMTPGQVTFAHEANRASRMASFADKHADPDIWDPSYMGDAIAKWNGDTLVIDSTNFKAERLYLDASGVPVSDKLQLVERIKLIDGGKQLENLITVTDPVIFAKPWTARLTFERRDDIALKTDWVCGEPHRDVSARPTLPVPAVSTANVPDARGAQALTAGQMALNGYWRVVPPPSAPGGSPAGAPPEGVAESRLAGLPPGSPPGGGAAPGAGPIGAIANKMQPWALAEFVKIHAIASAGQYFSTPTSRCLPSWVPGTGVPGGPAYNIAILVESRQVTFFAELDRMMRIVHIDQKHPTVLAPTWFGHSVGHWEGDTLVVDITGFNDNNVLANAVPMTSRMHIVERLRVVDGKLEDKATFDDPGALTGIFERTLRYAPGKAFQEYICAENNFFGGVPTSTGRPTAFTFPKAPAAAQPPVTRKVQPQKD